MKCQVHIYQTDRWGKTKIKKIRTFYSIFSAGLAAQKKCRRTTLILVREYIFLVGGNRQRL